MPVKLNHQQRGRFGIQGEADVDYLQHKDVIKLRAHGAFRLDAPDVPVLEAYPGDVIVIWSRVSLSPRSILVATEAHPQLLKSGFCSFPKYITEEHIGPVSVLFKCEQQLNLKELPWLLTIWSEGELRQ